MVKMRYALVALLATAAGCGSPKKPGGTVIAASFYPMYLAAANVAAGVPGVRVVNLTKPYAGCLHDYQLTPEEVKNLAGASALVVNGGGMEPFLEKLSAQLPRLRIIDASEGIELLDGVHGGKNPHVWVSVTGAMQQVRNVARGLAETDPKNAAAYRKNAERYLTRLDSLRQGMREGMKDIGKRDIVTFHEAFAYFAAEFGLNVAAVIEADPGSEPSAGELAGIVRLVRDRRIKALFAEPQYPASSAETVARETGAGVYTLDPVSTGPMDDHDHYIKAMEENLEVLREALK